MFFGRYEAGESYLATAFGLDVVEMPNARRDAEFLYPNPNPRAARASLHLDGRTIAKLQLHERDWVWKLVRESTSSLRLEDIDSKAVKDILESELRNST
jgi:hypothetical protein